MNKIDQLSVEGLRLINELIKTNSLKTAADNLHISASTAGRLLAKLRKIFDDKLFTRSGSQMLPTSLTLTIKDKVRRSINLLGDIQQRSEEFDPSTLRRTFKIAVHEAVFDAHFTPLCQKIYEIAPHVKLEIHWIDIESMEKLKLGELDFLFIPSQWCISEEINELPVTVSSFKILVRKNHPLLKKAKDGCINPENLAKFGKVQVLDEYNFSPPDGMDSWVLNNNFVRQNTVMWIPYLQGAVNIVKSTDLTFLVYSGFADMACAADEDIQSISIDPNIGKIWLAMKWHRNLDSDTACQWFRSIATAVFKESPPPTKSFYYISPHF